MTRSGGQGRPPIGQCSVGKHVGLTADPRTAVQPPANFTVKVWCRDCGHGQDPLGCFDGGEETLGPFDTYEQAYEAGREVTDGPPYDFAIVDRRIPQ